MTKNINTKRLTIGAIEEKDRAEVIAILRNDIVKKTYMLPDFEDDVAAGKLFLLLSELSRDVGRFVFGVYLNGKLIGFMNDTEINGDEIEMGYAFHPDHYNKGYATESFGAVIEYLFERGFNRVLAGAFEENPASVRVMEKCGMSRMDKTDDIEYRGKLHRCIYYVAEKDWHKLRPRGGEPDFAK